MTLLVIYCGNTSIMAEKSVQGAVGIVLVGPTTKNQYFNDETSE